jgi:hypothetical protein
MQYWVGHQQQQSSQRLLCSLDEVSGGLWQLKGVQLHWL